MLVDIWVLHFLRGLPQGVEYVCVDSLYQAVVGDTLIRNSLRRRGSKDDFYGRCLSPLGCDLLVRKVQTCIGSPEKVSMYCILLCCICIPSLISHHPARNRFRVPMRCRTLLRDHAACLHYPATPVLLRVGGFHIPEVSHTASKHVVCVF